MNKLTRIFIAFLLCLSLAGCGSNDSLEKYEWGSALQETLDEIGVEKVSDIVEDEDNDDETVFVDFVADDDKTLTAFMSKYGDEDWETVSIRDSDVSSIMYYYDTLDNNTVYDYKTGDIIKTADKNDKEDDDTPVEKPSEDTPVVSPQAPTTTVTMGQINAKSKALDYLAYTAFSYSGLISQLEYEGFSTEDSTYGVDNCGADWNQQAAKKAQDYLDYSSFSRQGLLDQLLYEGFTQEQANYGVTAVGY